MTEHATTKYIPRLYAAVFVFMIGFYEHSWIGIHNGRDDVFYICASWFCWIAGPLLALSGVIGLLTGKRGEDIKP